jgi:hypothetical protein
MNTTAAELLGKLDLKGLSNKSAAFLLNSKTSKTGRAIVTGRSLKWQNV